MTPCSQDFIKALISPIKRVFIKFDLYDINNNFITELSQEITQEDLSHLTIDTTRPIRRSFDFRLSKVDPTFTWSDSPGSHFWIDKRVKLYWGLMLANGTIEYIPQGVFIVSEPSDSHTLQKKKRLHVVGQDKMYSYTGKRGRFIDQVTIAKNTNIATAIQTIMTNFGNETLFNFDTVTAVTPYDLHFNTNQNIYDAIKQLADLAICDIYYDVNGYLRLKQINLDEFAQYPSVWSFDYTNSTERFYAGNERALDETNLANHIRVIGGSSQTSTIVYDLVVDENQSYTIEMVNNGTTGFAGTFVTAQSSANGLVLGQYGTNVARTLAEQADWNTGTLTNVSANLDNTLSLTTEMAIQLTGTLASTVTNAYYYNDIWNSSVLISSGDKLVYDIFMPSTNPQFLSGIDGYIQGVGALRNYSPSIVDQNNLSISPLTDISTKANGVWYHREFDLSSIAGKIISSFQVAFEGNNAGNYISYFKDAYIKDSSGNVKTNIFNYPSTALNSTTPISSPILTLATSTNGGSSGDYANLNLTTIEVASQISGNRTSPVIDISMLSTYGNSTVSWNYNADPSTVTNTNSSTVTVQSRLSTDGGNTWGSWATVTNGSSLPNLTLGTSMTNYRLQIQQLLNTTEPTMMPNISNFQLNVISEYQTSGTFTSNPINITTLQTSATGSSVVSLQTNTPLNTSLTTQISVSLDGGNTWGSYYTVYDGAKINEITSSIADLSKVKVKYKVNMSTTSQGFTPTLQSISFGAGSNLWKGNNYSIQKLGRILFLWNNGNADPLLLTLDDCRNRAKFEMQRRLGFSERVTLNVDNVPLLDGYDFIFINDPVNGTNGNYRIESISMPLIPNASLMTIQCTKFHAVLNTWNF